MSNNKKKLTTTVTIQSEPLIDFLRDKCVVDNDTLNNTVKRIIEDYAAMIKRGKDVNELAEQTIHKPKLSTHKDRERFGTRTFMLPVGNVFCWGVYKLIDESQVSVDKPMHVYEPQESYYHMAYSSPWWCPQDKIQDIRDLVDELDGFSLNVGVLNGGNEYMPHVINDKDDERKLNGYWHVNTKGVSALVGDTLIWLTIDDVDKANKTLLKTTRIPCYIQVDINKYTNDSFYASIFDKANYYFMYYYTHEQPIEL